jgi:hypothetical protein
MTSSLRKPLTTSFHLGLLELPAPGLKNKRNPLKVRSGSLPHYLTDVKQLRMTESDANFGLLDVYKMTAYVVFT